MAQQTIQQTAQPEPGRRARFKRYMSQSNWITDAWSWFMVLAGKAAEPVLILSVLYSSAKLLPAIQPYLTAQLDAAVFIAQFIALDVGGLSLNKMADQVQETNPIGARNAKRLSYALVGIMIAGVILASLSGIMSKVPQIAGGIDTTLLIARAILAVLYSRVIHSLKKEDGPGGPQPLNAPHPQPDINQAIEDQTQVFEQKLADQANDFERRLAGLKPESETIRAEYETKLSNEVERLRAENETKLSAEVERLRAEMERRIAHLRVSLTAETRNETKHETRSETMGPRLVSLPTRPVSPRPEEKQPDLPETGQQDTISPAESANCKAAVYALLEQDSSLQPIDIAARLTQPRTTVWRHWKRWHEEQIARPGLVSVERDETAS